MREKYVDIHAVAEHLDVKVSWLYNHADRAGLPCYKVGQKRRYRLSEVDAWAEQNRASL
ncbi:AlpA family transcriptional regulator [Haloactinopolyspora alba]|uniref:AlpA family transcriptional regulator n=1 Tax=Haloactinopolyspora alba TaxID=648780 RepID=A0A2P8E3Q0_9ACTN|nr:helix-turn-helix domain-containing protein [Haloactinopolyspora alba]PSL04090.1 AlpA family transcriptional regulator [Haloactinopolyspora alba]